MKKNKPIFPYRTVNVKCQRDQGFIRPVKVTYFLLENGDRFYVSGSCDMHCKTETCDRCCGIVGSLLNKVEKLPHDNPILLDPEKF